MVILNLEICNDIIILKLYHLLVWSLFVQLYKLYCKLYFITLFYVRQDYLYDRISFVIKYYLLQTIIL